ncbi:hypothetical protein VTO73DRAFT_1168 [Trametes versicolor]
MPSYARAPSVLPSDFHRATSRFSRIFAFCFPVSHLDTFIPFFLILHACDRLVHILFICEVSGTSGIYHYHGCSSFAVHIPRLSHRSLPFCVNRLDPASSQHCNSVPTVYYHTRPPQFLTCSLSLAHSSFLSSIHRLITALLRVVAQGRSDPHVRSLTYAAPQSGQKPRRNISCIPHS